MFVPRHKVRNRRFTYEPRYYDPTHDEGIKRRLRIKRRAKSKRRGRMSLFWILALLLMALYIYNSIN